MPRGGLRPAAQVPESFVEAWREAWRSVDYSGAWTYSVPQRSVDALRELAWHEIGIGGTELARRIGASPSTLCANTLPRLEEAELVTSTLGEPSIPGAKPPRVWRLTPKGRQLMEWDR